MINSNQDRTNRMGTDITVIILAIALIWQMGLTGVEIVGSSMFIGWVINMWQAGIIARAFHLWKLWKARR